jgi:uncharacterized protein
VRDLTIHTIVFAKLPKAGFAKTRLIPALGAEQAAELAHRMLLRTLNTVIEANLGSLELCVDPKPDHSLWLPILQDLKIPDTPNLTDQGEGDLGAKMARSIARSLGGELGSAIDLNYSAANAVILLGTDCPGISAPLLQTIATELENHDACLVPTYDGGYSLIALKRTHASLFSDIAWSTSVVFETTLQRLEQLKWRVKSMPQLHDIDEPSDLKWLPIDFGYK